MINKEQLEKALFPIKLAEPTLEYVLKNLNAENPALQFEIALHNLLQEYLQKGLTILEVVGAFECVKSHLQNDFNKANDKILGLHQIQIFNENQHGKH